MNLRLAFSFAFCVAMADCARSDPFNRHYSNERSYSEVRLADLLGKDAYLDDVTVNEYDETFAEVWPCYFENSEIAKIMKRISSIDLPCSEEKAFSVSGFDPDRLLGVFSSGAYPYSWTDVYRMNDNYGLHISYKSINYEEIKDSREGTVKYQVISMVLVSKPN
jgi:hypothetical protein